MANSILAQPTPIRNEHPSTQIGPVLSNLPRLISYTTAALVFLLAVGAFILSYATLWETALTYGLPPRLAWIWPLLIDFALIVFSLAVVRASLYYERKLWPWLLVAIYTLATITFNVIHAPDNLIAQIIAVVAPISLFLSFETLMGMLKSEVNRDQSGRQIDQLQAQLSELNSIIRQQNTESRQMDDEFAAKRHGLEEIPTASLPDPQDNYPTASTTDKQIFNVKPFIPGDLTALEKANQGRFAAIEARRANVKNLAAQDMSKQAIADSLQVSVATIKRDLAALRTETVLNLLKDGYDEPAIASRLGVTIKVVKSDIANLNGRAQEVLQ